MIPSYRQSFNAAFTSDKYQRFRRELAARCGMEVPFQISQTPCFFPAALVDRLCEDGKELMEEDAEADVMDAGLIGAAQHVEHYEIAGYGCVRTYANLLGMKNAVKLLEKTLSEEKATDEKLTKLAEAINVEAMDEEAA